MDSQNFSNLQKKVKINLFEFSKHATDQSIIRDINVQETKEVILNGQIIEDYPHDKYGPSCLIFGMTSNGRPLHIQVSYPARSIIKIITLYEPSPQKWLNYKTRK